MAGLVAAAPYILAGIGAGTSLYGSSRQEKEDKRIRAEAEQERARQMAIRERISGQLEPGIPPEARPS